MLLKGYPFSEACQSEVFCCQFKAFLCPSFDIAFMDMNVHFINQDSVSCDELRIWNFPILDCNCAYFTFQLSSGMI